MSLKTGMEFRPRGFNYIRLRNAGYLWHDTFNPASYDAKRTEAALADMTAHGFNIVRVFVDQSAGAGTVESRDSTELSDRYMANVRDFLRGAALHRIYVIFAMCYIPDSAPYRALQASGNPDVAGENRFFLDEGCIAAKARYMADFAAAIARADRGLLPTVFSYELDNEPFFITNAAPFSKHAGTFAFQGKEYALDSDAQMQALADAGTLKLANACADAVHKVDPEAMVAGDVFTFNAVGRSGPAHLLTDRTGDNRFPARALALAQSKLAYVDIHLYSTDEKGPRHDLESEEWDALKPACAHVGKPLLMGECGVFKSRTKSADEAASLLSAHVDRVMAEGFVGFLVWTYDTDEQADIWNATMDGGAILKALQAAGGASIQKTR